MAENNFQEAGRLVYSKGFELGALSDVTTAAVVVANANVFAMRNIGVEEIILERFTMKWLSAVAFAAAQQIHLAAYKVVGMTALPNSGVAVDATRKRTADHEVIPSAEFVATMFTGAAVLGAGTFTIVTDEPFDVAGGVGDVLPYAESIWYPQAGVPFTLGTNEGVVVRALNTHGAAGTGRLFIGAELRKA